MESKHVTSPTSPLSQLDSTGALTLNLTIPASDLVLSNKLGQGAYGAVYKAKWRNKDVAVKQLLLPNPTEQEKNEFKQEAAVMYQIATDSEHVVRLYKITMQPQLSLVMELMPNGSLYELLQNNRDKPLDWGIRYRLAMDISTGLEDIHSHGVLHRDLKSLNVLLDGNLRAKLTDFGLATTKLTSSRHSSVQGTPHWMAPEVANGDADSEGSDVYSMGMVCWELVTHRQPYVGLRPMQVMMQVAGGKQETIPADCPANFKQLILDCWSIAEKRPKAMAVTARLQPLLESKEAPTKPVAGGMLDSLTSGQIKGSANYHQASHSPKVAASNAAEQALKAELEKQKAEMEALKKQMAQLMQAGGARAPVVNPKPLLDVGRGRNPGFFEPKQSPAAQPVVDAKALGQLLKFVAEGEQDQAESLIKKDSKLLLAAGKVTDLSGRTFDNITAFQYALWAMDYHMWTMLQKHLPTEAQAAQHQVLESKGTAHGKHFDLQPLLGALKTYVDNYEPWSAAQCREHWSKKVGGAQKLLPAHVVNEYCRPDRPFDPCPAEWTSPLPRTQAVEVYIDSNWVKGPWFTPPTASESLGSSFAFCRVPGAVVGVAVVGAESSGEWPGGARTDLKSLQAVWNARTEQLKLLTVTLSKDSSQSAVLKFN